MTHYSSARQRAMRIAVQRGDAMRERAAMWDRIARLTVFTGVLILEITFFYGVTR